MGRLPAKTGMAGVALVLIVVAALVTGLPGCDDDADGSQQLYIRPTFPLTGVV